MAPAFAPYPTGEGKATGRAGRLHRRNLLTLSLVNPPGCEATPSRGSRGTGKVEAAHTAYDNGVGSSRPVLRGPVTVTVPRGRVTVGAHASGRQYIEGYGYVPLSRSRMSSLRRSGSSCPTPDDRPTDQPALSTSSLPLRIARLRLGRELACQSALWADQEEAMTIALR